MNAKKQRIVIRTDDGRTFTATDTGKTVQPGELADTNGHPIDDDYVKRATGPGRPPLNQRGGPSRSLVLRIDDPTLQALKAAAAAQGVSAAEWVRTAVRDRLAS